MVRDQARGVYGLDAAQMAEVASSRAG
jgi:hypothetical protein